MARGAHNVRRMRILLLLALLFAQTVCFGNDLVFPTPPPPHPDYAKLSTDQAYAAAVHYTGLRDAWAKAEAEWMQTLTYKEREKYSIAHGYQFGPRPPDPVTSSDYFWYEAGVRQQLSPAEVSQLDRDGLVVTECQWRQSFSAYLDSHSCSYFITTDSLLNAFHTLMESTILQVEIVRHERLKEYLLKVWTGLDTTDPKLRMDSPAYADGRRQAHRVLGVALELLGVAPKYDNDEEKRQVKADADRVRKADGLYLPDFLAPANDQLVAIDYSRFKPVGIYTQTKELSETYQAVRWLQTVPFRIDRVNELLAIDMIGGAGSRLNQPAGVEILFNKDGAYSIEEVSEVLNTPRDSIGGLSSKELQAQLAEQKDFLSKYLNPSPFSPTNDQITSTGQTGRPRDFRILPTYDLTEAQVWRKLANDSHIPSKGWEVGAILGSGFAGEELDKQIPGATQALQKEAENTYLSARSYNFQKPDEDEKREYLKVMPKGFFTDFRDWSLYTSYLVSLTHLFDKPDPNAPDFMRTKAWEIKSTNTALASWAQMRHSTVLATHEDYLCLGIEFIPSGFVEPNPDFYRSLADTLSAYFQGFYKAGLLEGKVYDPTPRRVTESNPYEWDKYDNTLLQRWMLLIDMTHRLEALSHKQLRGIDWDEADNRFIIHYGRNLATVMGYMSDNCHGPDDNAPRIITTQSDPLTGNHQQVGITHPVSLYVLYPWKGKKILCQGIILPYRVVSAPERLTDETWREQLKDGKAAPCEDWLKPLVK